MHKLVLRVVFNHYNKRASGFIRRIYALFTGGDFATQQT